MKNKIKVKELLNSKLLEDIRRDKRREKSLEKMRALTQKLLGDGLISNEMAKRFTGKAQ